MNSAEPGGTSSDVSVAADVLPFAHGVSCARIAGPAAGARETSPHNEDVSCISGGACSASSRSNADDDLVARAARGEPEAFKELFVRHRSDVARLVYRMLHASGDLEDVVQEVFFQVFRSLKDFRGQAKFSTWLHRVTVNVALMHRRSARSRPVLTEEIPGELARAEDQALPDDVVERRERMRAFQRLLGRLADKKRVVFVLHELEGMSQTEIAEIVGAPVFTVRTRLFYARRELESMLDDEPALAGLASLANVSRNGSTTDE